MNTTLIPDIRMKDEFDLAELFKKCFRKEEWEKCAEIKAEINRRIDAEEITSAMMDVFREYNIKTATYSGDYDFRGLNGLFDRYFAKK